MEEPVQPSTKANITLSIITRIRVTHNYQSSARRLSSLNLSTRPTCMVIWRRTARATVLASMSGRMPVSSVTHHDPCQLCKMVVRWVVARLSKKALICWRRAIYSEIVNTSSRRSRTGLSVSSSKSREPISWQILPTRRPRNCWRLATVIKKKWRTNWSAIRSVMRS